jgi:UDPglucose 6-dehydrogenase
VFIAVPTPTTPRGFDYSIVLDVLSLVGKGRTAVIKSTLLPGTTELLQAQYPDLAVMHSPEFLSVATAQYDAEHPTRNIIGVAVDSVDYRTRAREVMSILPEAPYSLICTAREAELIKYGRNCLGFVRVVFINLIYDLARRLDIDWEPVRQAMAADPDCGPTYLNPIHKSGRGAGRACFIKDFEALSRLYREVVDDELGAAVLDSLTAKNIDLLLRSEKDLELLRGVHGDRVGSRLVPSR